MHLRYIDCALVMASLMAMPAGLSGGEGAGVERAADASLRGELASVLEQLAASAERITMGGRMGSAGDGLPDVINLGRAARFLSVLPADRQYESLKDWMLPREPGAMTRSAMCFAPVEFPPERFFSDVHLPHEIDAAQPRWGTVPGRDGVICFSEMLVVAAAACGKIPELAEAAARFDNSAHMADTLMALTSYALPHGGDTAERVDAYLAQWQQEVPVTGQLRHRTWTAYVTSRAWVREGTYREQGERLAARVEDFARSTEQQELLAHLLRDRAVWCVQQHGATLRAGADPGLALWHPGGYYFTGASQVGTWPGWWVERDGILRHVSGPEVSPLYFDYPLAGTFEVEVDGFCSAVTETRLQYGRLLFEPFWREGKAQLSLIGQRESVQRPAPAAAQDRFHPLTVRVTPEKVSYLCDGVVVLDDEGPSPTTPWLALLGCATRTTAWSGLRLKGDPQVLPEVELIQGNRMEGWMSPLYRESLPRQLHSIDPVSGPVMTFSSPSTRGAAWFASDGVLQGPSLQMANQSIAIQSWLAYHRPLRTGETLSYEFYYQPDAKLVHPALGRVALLLDPAGVRLHWITDVPHMDVGGLRADNAIEIVQDRRGPAALPLRPDAWNSVVIRMAADRASLLINGTEVYEHPLAPADSRMFGLFRYRNRMAAEVRRIVLRGNWPERLSAEQMRQPAARADQRESAASLAGRQALVGDTWAELRDQAR